MESFDVGKLTIPLFIGTVMNWGLLGALLVQVYIYFVAFPNDRRISKILVAAITVAELLQTMGDSRDSLESFGAGWGNPEALDNVGWAWLSVPVLGSSIASAGQIFFAWRIYIIGGSLVIPAVIAAVTVVQLGAGIWTGVSIAHAGKFSRLQFRTMKQPVVWLSATAVADLIIVGGMVFYILKARVPGFRRSTDAAVFRIIKSTVETGLLCATFALLDLSLFVAYNGNNYHLAVCIWLSKVYSNSIMVILNSRAHIGHAPPPDGMSHLTDIAFHSGAQIAVETDSTITRDSDAQATAPRDVGKEAYAV